MCFRGYGLQLRPIRPCAWVAGKRSHIYVLIYAGGEGDHLEFDAIPSEHHDVPVHRPSGRLVRGHLVSRVIKASLRKIVKIAGCTRMYSKRRGYGLLRPDFRGAFV